MSAQPEDDIELGFFEHLRELRTRVIRALVGILPAILVAWAFKERILGATLAPLITAYERHGIAAQIHFSSPAAKIVAYLKLSILVGFFLAAPWIFYQIWAFISPGLYRRERLMALPFVFASTLCFVGGALFGYFLVFPLIFDTLIGFGGEVPGLELTPTLMISEVLDFIVRLVIAFGAVFEVPVVVVFLAIAGIVDWRTLMRFGRYWAVIAAVVAAVITPPDAVSQLMLLGPMIVLYYIAVLIAYILTGGKTRESAVDEEGVEYER
ncbi:MAG: twin-arginine translocase subunit TatC [Sandaracinaceae bacterium]|nr:twin-arginine translocase subunit TatC [Sandaracinaceae bacterium]